MTCGKSLRAIDLKLSRRCCREFGGSLMNLQMMQKMMDDAVAHHRAGRIGDAERAYRDILQLNRHHTDALNLLASEDEDGNVIDVVIVEKDLCEECAIRW